MRLSPRDAVSVSAALLLAATGSALAATPRAGYWTGATPAGASLNDSEASFIVRGSTIVGTPLGGSRLIRLPTSFRCNAALLIVDATTIPIQGGSFSFSGTADVVRGVRRGASPKGEVTWTGRFVSGSRVRGTVRFRSPVTPVYTGSRLTLKKKPCDSGTEQWSGTLRPAR